MAVRTLDDQPVHVRIQCRDTHDDADSTKVVGDGCVGRI